MTMKTIDPPTEVREVRTLAVIEAEIDQQVGRLKHTKLKLGRLLLEAKEQVEHGQWSDWVEARGIKMRSAQNYMALAKNANLAHLPDDEDVTYADLGMTVSSDRFAELPEAVGMYRDVLNDSHLEVLMDVREIYGPKLVRQFNKKATVDIEDEKDAAKVLVALRPEARIWCFTCDLPEVVVEACRTFLGQIEASGHCVPQWTVAAFWFASMAVIHRLKVLDLTRSVYAWHQRHLSAVWYIDAHPQPVDTGDLTRLWWGFASDLRHSGSFERVKFPRTDEDCELLVRSLRWVARQDSYVLPSSFDGQDAA